MNHMRIRGWNDSRCRLALLALCVWLTGCWGGPTLVPVEGEIKVDNAPLAKGAVMFWPDKDKGNSFTGQPSGQVENGKFKLLTKGRPGAPTGWYKVTVADGEIPDSAKPLKTKSAVARRFGDAAKTPLEIEVAADVPAGHYAFKASKK